MLDANHLTTEIDLATSDKHPSADRSTILQREVSLFDSESGNAIEFDVASSVGSS